MAEGVRGDAEAALGVAERLLGVLEDEAGGRLEGLIQASGGVRFIEPPVKLVVIGDIHGDLDTLAMILSRARVPEILDEDRVGLVFLGDYVDRGPAQIEVMALIAELKALYGGRVLLLRGNHEPPPGLLPYPHDFPSMLLALYGDDGRRVYEAFYRVFQAMPYAAVAGPVLMMHGGLPTYNYRDASSLEEYLEAGRKPSQILLEEVLWNDPSDYVDEWAPSPRGAGRLFGPRVTEHVCRVHGCSLVVRGHEPSATGYKYNHGGRVLTLFSRLGPPYMNEKAAFLRLSVGLVGVDKKVETVGSGEPTI